MQTVIAPLALPPLPRGVAEYEQAQQVDEELDGPSVDYRAAAAAVAEAAAALADAPAAEVPEEEVWLRGCGGSGEEGSGDEEGDESPSPAAVRAAARADARAVVAYAAADSRRAPRQPAWRVGAMPSSLAGAAAARRC